jgi:hypothetical protein
MTMRLRQNSTRARTGVMSKVEQGAQNANPGSRKTRWKGRGGGIISHVIFKPKTSIVDRSWSVLLFYNNIVPISFGYWIYDIRAHMHTGSWEWCMM